MSSQPTFEPDHYCYICNKRFSDPYGLIRHLKAHNSDANPSHKEYSAGRFDLFAHERVNHEISLFGETLWHDGRLDTPYFWPNVPEAAPLGPRYNLDTAGSFSLASMATFPTSYPDAPWLEAMKQFRELEPHLVSPFQIPYTFHGVQYPSQVFNNADGVFVPQQFWTYPTIQTHSSISDLNNQPLHALGHICLGDCQEQQQCLQFQCYQQPEQYQQPYSPEQYYWQKQDCQFGSMMDDQFSADLAAYGEMIQPLSQQPQLQQQAPGLSDLVDDFTRLAIGAPF